MNQNLLLAIILEADLTDRQAFINRPMGEIERSALYRTMYVDQMLLDATRDRIIRRGSYGLASTNS